MTLLDAPFSTALKVISLRRISEEARLILMQLGIEPEEELEKVHSAPLGDPISIRIGEQLFSLRSEICACIEVESHQ